MSADLDRLLADVLADPAGDRRILVVVAHPDDEVLGCGALLARTGNARVIHVTDGAPRNGEDARRHGFATPAAYAAARASEAKAALEIAGVPPDRLSTLGLADQEASLHLAQTARCLAEALDNADVVLTHAFEGGHSDHDAVAFAVHAAMRLKAKTSPLVVEMPFYHAAPDGWRRQHFLPWPGAGREYATDLDQDMRRLKERMMAAHRTQAETLRGFDTATERFRVAPAYDFAARPHGGDLLYERHGWALDWSAWVDRVRQAESDLGLGRAA